MLPDQTDRDRVRAAFAATRKAGVTARMNYKCCSGCALAALSEDGLRESASFVFFHSQDAEAFAGSGALNRSLYVAHGGYGARVLLAALAAVGQRARWDGDHARRIEVLPS